MGNSVSGGSTAYAVPVADALVDGEERTRIYRCAQYPDEIVWDLPGEDVRNGWGIFQRGLSIAGRNGPFISSRRWSAETEETDSNSAPAEVRWLTYGQVESLALKLGYALTTTETERRRHRQRQRESTLSKRESKRDLRNLRDLSVATDDCVSPENPENPENPEGLENESGNPAGSGRLVKYMEFENELIPAARRFAPLGMYSKNRPEWLIFEQVSNAFDLTLVPLYDTLGEAALLYILTQTDMSVVCCSGECCDLLFGFFGSVNCKAKVGTIILFDHITDVQTQNAKTWEIDLIFWKDLLIDTPPSSEISPLVVDSDSLATLCFTSGTTGNPKGVVLTAKNLVANVTAAIRGCLSHPGFKVLPSDLHISYLPLAHVFERIIVSCVIASGARVGCFSGDTMKLLDDLKHFQPTVFLSVPRLFLRINDRIFAGIKEKSALAQFLFFTGLDSKLSNLRNKGIYSHQVWDALVFGKTKKLMGGRLRWMIVGGAPMDAEVQERMSVLFCCPLLQGFGMSELGATIISLPNDRISGHIGGVQPCNEFLLRSDGAYSVKDNPPTGELLIRGHSVTPGYFKQNQETTESRTLDGFFQTGDIAALLPSGALRIVDRKKNILKLSQGEYVAPERLELIYGQATLVAQIFVHGDSSKNCLVAIIVPEEEMLEKWCLETHSTVKSDSQMMQTLCVDPKFKQAVAKQLDAQATEAKLKGFEKVKEFHLHPKIFSVENGLLTPTLKLKRHEARKEFQDQITAMYKIAN